MISDYDAWLSKKTSGSLWRKLSLSAPCANYTGVSRPKRFRQYQAVASEGDNFLFLVSNAMQAQKNAKLLIQGHA